VPRPVDGDLDSSAVCDIGAYEHDLLIDVFLPLLLKGHSTRYKGALVP
jgi:hypothetical protein